MLRKLKKIVDQFMTLDLTRPKSFVYQAVISEMYAMCAHILLCEAESIHREEIIDVINPIREIYSKSPFLFRLQTWPNGYPGDYETIEYLWEARNRSTQNTLQYYCEEFALTCPPAQQHRNKITIQSNKILRSLFNSKQQKRILSISSGNTMDIRSIKHFIEKTSHQIVLLDTDPKALDFACDNLKEIASQCIFIKGFATLSDTQKKIKEIGRFDFVTTGGLFDYLKDKHIVRLLQFIFNELLSEQGTIFFTNIDIGNPYKTWMEYFVNWILIERSKEDIHRIMQNSQISGYEISIQKESSGLTNIIDIKKAKTPAKTAPNNAHMDQDGKPVKAFV
jgi:extracellular factor (EF) 3-hydroxypalmitic acid methyl ester biosynthesis protein